MGSENSTSTHSEPAEEASDDSDLSDIRIYEQNSECNVRSHQYENTISGWPAKRAINMVNSRFAGTKINDSMH